MNGLGRARKVRFYVSVSAVYALTLIFVASGLNVGLFRKVPVYANAQPLVPVAAVKITSGKPVRVIVPRLGIDLPTDDGAYDIANQTWTISGYHAQFALPSVVANDYQGNTLIYGHNNIHVFWKLKELVAGDQMQLITDNGKTFNYIYAGSADVQPNDLSVFKYDGPPSATLQTCTGAWNEIRTLYHFEFDKVSA